MNRTAIEWTTFSANPLKYRDAAGRVVWGCVHASEGCRHCYSEALAKRYGRGGPFTPLTMKGLTPFLDEAELRHMLKAKVIGGMPVAGSRCFVGDMTDLFGEWVPDQLLDRLFSTFAWRRHVTWQILTKRAERLRVYSAGLAALEPKRRTLRFVDSIYQGHPAERLIRARVSGEHVGDLDWPLPNVWLGVSVENQATADERIPLLLQTPASKRFVSYEPALGPVDFTRWLYPECGESGMEGDETPALSWLIVGGESGAVARGFDYAWARSVVRQCHDAGVAVFVKQLGASPYEMQRQDHTNPSAVSQYLKDRKGGDSAEWPEDLRVREMPA